MNQRYSKKQNISSLIGKKFTNITKNQTVSRLTSERSEPVLIAEGNRASEASVGACSKNHIYLKRPATNQNRIFLAEQIFFPLEGIRPAGPTGRPVGPGANERCSLVKLEKNAKPCVRSNSVFSDKYLIKKKPKISLEKRKPYLAWYSCDSLHQPELRTVCSCNDWILCHYCKVKRQVKNKRRVDNYWEAVEQERKTKKNLSFQTYKFITLTQKWKEGSDLKFMFDLIQKNFKKLRNRKSWKKNIPSGYFTATYEISEDMTNVHVHIIALSKFWDVYELSKEWQEITNDSFIVDIRPISSIGDAIQEVIKYIVKDTNPKLVSEMSEFRKLNPKRRYLVSGRRPSLLDTIAITEHPKCSICSSKMGLHGEFKDELAAHTWLTAKMATTIQSQT
jgi:SepF-like predicted cell division protein (DUF552 family)